LNLHSPAVIQLLAGSSINAIAAATSSASPMRLSGCMATDAAGKGGGFWVV
jgi:hypothetical protein